MSQFLSFIEDHPSTQVQSSVKTSLGTPFTENRILMRQDL